MGNDNNSKESNENNQNSSLYYYDAKYFEKQLIKDIQGNFDYYLNDAGNGFHYYRDQPFLDPKSKLYEINLVITNILFDRDGLEFVNHYTKFYFEKEKRAKLYSCNLKGEESLIDYYLLRDAKNNQLKFDKLTEPEENKVRKIF